MRSSFAQCPSSRSRMSESVCESCGAPLAADATACPACGWVARGTGPLAVDPVDLWPDDEELAQKVEEAVGGEYEIHGLIGRGGMATVFLGRELALERDVAIKVMAPHVMRSYGMADRFKREARVAAALSHPNIIPIHAVRESGSLVCLIMKRLTGRSLDQIIRDHHPVPVAIAQVILRDIAAGLEFAHQRGVIHRDVKPANILVDQHGAVVVTDFGIAKAREVDALTASGTSIGTPAYMSPEQALGKRATPASDQYSLGVLAYELLCGRMPFIAETAMGVMYQHTHTPPEPLQELRPDLPAEVAAAVERMLAKRPVDRFPTLTDASRALGIPASAGALDDPVRLELARLAGPGTVPKRRSSGSTGRTSGTTSRGSRPPTDPNATTLQMLDLVRRRRVGVGLGAIALIVFAALGERARERSAAPGPLAVTPSPASSVARPRTTPPTGPGVAPTRSTVQSAIERYRRAVESRSLPVLRAAYPAMEPAQVATYREFFRTADQIRFEVIIKDLEQKDGEARMKLQGFLRYRERKTGVEKITPYGTRARLVNGPTGWRILEIR